MKLLSVSLGLILAAMGVFYIPVSFAVDGFGLIVSPGGVRTLRAGEAGTVLHFPAEGGSFQPGDIVSAVTSTEAVAENALLLGTMYAELAKVEAEHLEKVSKIETDLERDRAKRMATVEQLAARNALLADTIETLEALQAFTVASLGHIDALNEERMAQLARLEELVKRSGEVSALPAQRLATMLEEIQSDRLSVITSKGATFSTDKMILDMVKARNDLTFSNAIDEAEIAILEKRVTDQEQQIADLVTLRDSRRAEAEAKYLAKAQLPQVAVASGVSVDMRTMQASRAEVAKADALRMLATSEPLAGLSLLIYGAAASGEVTVTHGARRAVLALPADPGAIATALRGIGLDVAQVYRDREVIGAVEVVSVFVALSALPEERLSVPGLRAYDAQGVPVLVTADISLPEGFGSQAHHPGNEIIGFLENRHAVVLKPGQPVRGSISDTRTGAEIVFEAMLVGRDVSTVDTQELGIRLGNASLADKIIKRGVVSQVVIEVRADQADRIAHLPGAVVHLSFPLGRQSLFSFLMAKNAAI
ncbi:MAG: hypothetical protein KDK24_05610 [Pseudooceanicola sp.]|nr:hypothetical protein [Pseudooceanicola sp.]